MKTNSTMWPAVGAIIMVWVLITIAFLVGYNAAKSQIETITEKAADKYIAGRLVEYEWYIVTNIRSQGEIMNRHADTIDRHQWLLDSLLVECEVNRACWLRMAGKR